MYILKSLLPIFAHKFSSNLSFLTVSPHALYTGHICYLPEPAIYVFTSELTSYTQVTLLQKYNRVKDGATTLNESERPAIRLKKRVL